MSDPLILTKAATSTSGNEKVDAAPGSTQQGRHEAAKAKIAASWHKGKWVFLIAAVAVIGGLAYAGWEHFQPPKLPAGFASSNGRIEATEIDVATKLAGRIVNELVDEGDSLKAGQVVAHMDIATIQAELREAKAKQATAMSMVDAAKSMKAQRESERAAAEAVVAQHNADLDLAKKNLVRAEQVARTPGAISEQQIDTDRSAIYADEAAVNSAKANVAAADAAISTAEAAIIAAESAVADATATIERVQADIDDSTLKAPRAGRVQYRVAQPGEVLPGGGKVLNMVDLADVYMTFFLPTDWAGRVQQGAEVRLVLDAAPQFVIPAKVTFVADVAQFTPKTVETAEERQKLTFRIKAHIDPKVLEQVRPRCEDRLAGSGLRAA